MKEVQLMLTKEMLRNIVSEENNYFLRKVFDKLKLKDF